MSGHVINVYGRTGTDSWEDALSQILEKLCKRGSCTVVGKNVFGELKDFKAILTQRVSLEQAITGTSSGNAHAGHESGKEG